MKRTILFLCISAVLVAGTAYASTWTPQGGSPTTNIPDGSYTGCKVDSSWREGQIHPKKWIITTEDPPGTLVLDADAQSEDANKELAEAKAQNDSDNKVNTGGGNGTVTGVDSTPGVPN